MVSHVSKYESNACLSHSAEDDVSTAISIPGVMEMKSSSRKVCIRYSIRITVLDCCEDKTVGTFKFNLKCKLLLVIIAWKIFLW